MPHPARLHGLRALAAALVLTLAACAPQPRVPLAAPDDLARTFPLPPAETERRFAAAASRLGLVVGADGAATGIARPGSAACPRVRVTLDGSQQIREARQLETTARITPSFVAQGDGTRVSLQPRYVARYLHTLRYDWFDRACEATGSLERAILDTMAAG